MQNYKGTNMSVSESEKLGMTGAGCRFIEKVEHVPIKKRWFLFGSPSPPPITQSTEEPEGIQNIQHNSSQNFNLNSTIGSEKKASDATTSADIDGTGVDEKKTYNQGHDHCISGISVLATVACSNVSGGTVAAGMQEVPVKTEPAETKISTNLLSDQQPCSSLVLHAPVKTERHDGSSYLPIPVITSQDLRFDTIRTLENVNHDPSQNVISGSHSMPNKDDSDETVRDGRLHWDLNTAMDAWDRPLDGDEPINDNNIVDTKSLDIDRRLTDVPSATVSGTPKNEAKLIASNTTLNVCDFPREIGGDVNNSSIQRALAPLEFQSLSVERQGTEVKDLKLDTKNIVISKENSSAEIKKTNSVFDKDRSDALPMPLFASTHTSVHVQETINPQASQLAASDSYVAPSISFGANTESYPSDACERVQPIVSVDKTIYCPDANIIGQEHNNPSLSEQTFNKERLEEDDGYHQNDDIHASELRMDYDSQYEDGELRESSLHDWEEDDGEDLDIDRVDYGSDNRDTNNVDSENTECNSQVQPGGGSFRSGVVDVGYLQDDTAAAASSTAGLSVHCSVDQVDASKASGSIADDQAIGDDDKGDVSQMNVAEIETDKEIDLKARTSGWDLMPPIGRRSSSDMVSGGGGTRFRNTEKDAFSYRRDRSEAENKERKSFDSGVNNNNNNRSEVFSRIERPASGRVFLGKDRLGPRGDSSIEDDSFFRSEREFGGVRPFGGRGGRYHHPLQRGGRGDNLWGSDSSAGYERGGGMKRMRSSPGYHHGGMGSTRHCGGPGDMSDGRRVNSRRYNNGRNGSPPDDRIENNYMHRGGIRSGGGGVEMSPGIGVGRGGGRGGARSGARYGGPPQIEGGGGPRGGGRYHNNNNAGAIENDNVESSSMNNNSYMHPLSVRGGGRRSFSPPPERRGGNNQFGPKSHLGSRARSPDAGWQPRNANMGFRNRSRSPNFRPRGGRSSPFSSRPDFVGEQESGGFAGGPSMDRDSPQSSKWMNYKQQQQRGGGRAWGNDEMMEPNNSRKMNNNNEYGRSVYPTRHHSEFNGVGRGGGRPRYELSDDNRKEYRFRHGGGGGGGLKRFRYNEVGGEEDDFGNNSREKEGGMVEFHRRTGTTIPNNNVAAAAAYHEKGGGGGGEAGRRSSGGEERGHFLQRQERKYNNNNKSVVVGMQESDDDMAAAPPPRRRIW